MRVAIDYLRENQTDLGVLCVDSMGPSYGIDRQRIIAVQEANNAGRHFREPEDKGFRITLIPPFPIKLNPIVFEIPSDPLD